MKSASLILIILISVFAGNPCRSITITNDPFNNEVIKEGNEFAFIDKLFRVKFTQINTQTKISIEIIEQGDVEKKLPAGSEIKLAFEDNKMISLTVAEDIEPVAGVRNYDVVTSWLVTTNISNEQLEIFYENNITAVNLPDLTNDQMKTITITSNRASENVLQDQVDAILNGECE